MRIVFFHLATSGPKRHKKYEIIQLGAVAVEMASLEAVEEFECKLTFDLDVADHQVLSAGPYDPHVWSAHAISPKAAAEEFGRFLHRFSDVDKTTRHGNPYTVAQLATFRAQLYSGFLSDWYRDLGLFQPWDFTALCVAQRASWWFLEQKLTPPADSKLLATLCERFGIDPGSGDALAEAKACLVLYRTLMRGGIA